MLTVDEDQQLVRDAVERLLAARDPAAERARLRADGTSFSVALWAECVEMGLPGILVPPALGGSGLGIAGAVMASEAFGRALAPAPFLSSAVLGGMLLPVLAEAAAHASHLTALMSGDLFFALSDGVAGGNGPRLADAANGWVLDGEIPFVADGGAATLLGVVARGPDAPMLAFVPLPAPGAQVTPRRLVDERDGASIRFDRCAVPAASVIRASPHIERARDVARLCLAAEMVGLCDAALAITLDHVRQRRQFDRHIGSFQAVQHQLAALHCEVELLRSAVLGGVEAAGRADFPQATALAKAKASRLGPMAMNTCLQLHGGVGMTDEFAVGHLLKRAKVLAHAFGDEDACLEMLIA